MSTATLNDLRRRVARYRAENAYPIPYAVAVAIVRADRNPETYGYEFLAGLADALYEAEAVESTLPNGLTVKAWIEPDIQSKIGEDDVTGTFTDVFEPGCIRNTTARGNGSGYEWYKPASATLTDTFQMLRQSGMSKSVATDRYREILQQEMADDSEREYYGVSVSVEMDGKILAEQSLWGIDATNRYSATPYLIETAAGLIGAALEEAQANVPDAIARGMAHVAKLIAIAPPQ